MSTEHEEKELSEGGIRARFVMEEFTYYDPNAWSISISKATTTVGGRLVSEDHDLTGIMLWPASHLMCQHLVQGDNIPIPTYNDDASDTTYSVLELGCGCGLVSLVGILRNTNVDLWMATDMDPNALELCRKNFAMHGMNGDNGRARIRSLAWGNEKQIDEIRRDLLNACRGKINESEDRFDAIVGADIVYPDTDNATLIALFSTVDALLKPNGTFYLAFATRDGAKTPSRLLRAASDAGFGIERLPALASEVTRKLPPLLDSKLLILRRKATARQHDFEELGSQSCAIFPGLWDAVARLENPSSDEEWSAPFAGSDDDEE
jgi:SAM-dependent methyltransferase